MGWTSKSYMPYTVYAAGYCTYDSKIYIIGGVDDAVCDAGSYVKKIVSYDPSTNDYDETLTDMSTVRDATAVGVHSGSIYVAGGFNKNGGGALKLLEKYDVSADSWTTLTDMPAADYYTAGAVYGDYFYVFGGASYDSVYKYDINDGVSGSWATVDTNIGAGNHPIAVTIDNFIWVISGDKDRRKVRKWNPSTDEWASGSYTSSLKTIYRTAFGVNDSKIYIAGGNTVDDFISYDTATDTWDNTLPDIPNAIFLHAGGIVDDTFYIMGGKNSSGVLTNKTRAYALDDVEVFDIPGQTIDPSGSFNSITLDDYVYTSKFSKSDLTWTHSGDSDLTVNITNRVAAITPPDSSWTGEEVITFKATDPSGSYDSDAALFRVNGAVAPGSPESGSSVWTERTEMPEDAKRAGSCVYDGKIYIVGGENNYDGRLDSVFSYDSNTGIYNRLSYLIVERYNCAVAAFEGTSGSTISGSTIFAAGGVSNKAAGGYLKSIEKYDIETDTWYDNLTDMDNISGGGKGVAYGNYFYLFGGNMDVVYKYDINADSWSVLKDSYQAHVGSYAVAEVIGNYIWVIGGSADGDAVRTWDPSTDDWSGSYNNIPSEIAPIAGGVSCVYGNKIYIASGIDQISDKFISYDPATDTWDFTTLSDMLLPRQYAAGGYAGGKLYVMGGIKQTTGIDVTNFNESYTFTLPPNPGGDINQYRTRASQ